VEGARAETPLDTRASILIVEDDADLREALSQVLRDEGYEVLGAAHGREALDRLRGGRRPSLILLDLTMPVMNGWQFRAEQREDPELSRIPVIVLSAGQDLPAQMPVLGLQDYIRKPIRLESLLESVERLCGR
jgi:CheY-like chemotaxis protein